MKKYRYILLLFALSAGILSGCSKDDEIVDPEPVSRTVFAYFAMDDNGMSSVGSVNINDMVSGAAYGGLYGGKIVVFFDSGNQTSLIQISADENGKVKRETLKSYSVDPDSSLPATLKMAIADMQALAPAKSYGMVAGSHGRGWMPASMHPQYGESSSGLQAAPLTRGEDVAVANQAFLNDGQNWMDLDDFVDALPDDTFDFIIMDLCLMGSAEFGYALSKKTDYLVVSPPEVLLAGFPYKEIVPLLFLERPILGAGGVAQKYYEHYRNKGQFAAVALYNCAHFEEFAGVMNGLLSPKRAEISSLDITSYARYDRFFRHTMFDMRQFVYSLYDEDSPQRLAFDKAFDKLVPYRAATSYALGNLTIDLDNYSGMSTYIPVAQYGVPGADLNTHFFNTAWGRRVYGTAD